VTVNAAPRLNKPLTVELTINKRIDGWVNGVLYQTYPASFAALSVKFHPKCSAIVFYLY
jgi:hypothetical protein